MAFHLALYSASIASVTANLQLAAVSDVAIAPAGNGFLVNAALPKLIRAAGVGNLLNRFQLSSASIRDHTPFDMNPVSVGTVIGAPAPFQDFGDQPIVLSPNEELDAFVTNSGAGATQTTVGVWFADGPVAPVRGPLFSVHWTAAATLVAHAWTPTAITLDNGLPSGTFAIVGARFISASGLFARFIPRGGAAWRPGTFACQTDAAMLNAKDRYGAMGEWMRFTNTTPPQVEYFALAADTAEEGYIDLIQVA